MGFKEKIIGLLLIIMGALPWLLKIEKINAAIDSYAANPGGYIYQAVLIILGLFLIVKFRPKPPVQVQPAQK